MLLGNCFIIAYLLDFVCCYYLTSIEAKLKFKRVNRNRDSLPLIYLRPWDVVNPSPRWDTIRAGCFQTLDENSFGKTIVVDAKTSSKMLGCPLRLPANIYIRIIEAHFSEDIGFVQLISGTDPQHLEHTSGRIYERSDIEAGPFVDPFVILQFKATSKDDSMRFEIFPASPLR